MEGSHDPDNIVRLEVPPNLQAQLRLYRRLSLAKMDLGEAKATVEELLARRIPLPRSKPPSALLTSLTTALVVAYARPFVDSRGQSKVADKAVPGVILQALTSAERELHELLLHIRNKEVAHSDAEILDVIIKLYGDGDQVILTTSLRAPFERRMLREIHRMIGKLEDALRRRCIEIQTELPLNTWL